MHIFLLDASALVKRYAPKPGDLLVDHLFASAARERLACLTLGAAEVAAVLVRKRNAGRLTSIQYAAALLRLRLEVIDALDFAKDPADDGPLLAALPFLDKYSLNATDALLLRIALDKAAFRRLTGDDVVLVTTDLRLARAAHAEGLLTFNPEMQTQADLDALLQDATP